MNYNVRISDNFLRGDHVDGEVLQHTDLNELENVAKTAINANYEDIQKLQDGVILSGNAEKLDGATLSKFATETLQNSDTKVPTSSQVKQYVDGAISTIDLDGYYTKREIDETLEDYTTFDDYASPSKTGVVKIDYNYGTDIDSETGVLKAGWDGYLTYQNRDNKCFISKGTLEGVIAGKGLITNTVSDLINYYSKEHTITTLENISTLNLNIIDAGFYYIKNFSDNIGFTIGTATERRLEPLVFISEWKASSDKFYRDVNFIMGGLTYTIERSGTEGSYTYRVSNSNWFAKDSDINDVYGYIDDELEDYVKNTDLTDYVKFTDYATTSKGGVITVQGSYNLGIYNGGIYPLTKTYEQYQAMGGNTFIGKATLENVITGKGLATKEDLLIKEYKDVSQANALNFNTMDAGFYYTTNCYITIGEQTFLEDTGGSLWYITEYDLIEPDYGSRDIYDITHGVYEQVFKDGDSYEKGSTRSFIYEDMVDYRLSFYTTKSYVDGLVGDIAEALDTINGESVGD